MSSGIRKRLGRKNPEGADLEQIEAVYRRSAARLRRVAAAIIGDREAALEAVQTGFSIAVRRRADFRDEGHLDAWIWRIVVTEARDARARLFACDRAESKDDASEGVLVAHEDGARDERPNALAELSERQRLVVFLRYYTDFDYPTIARVLAINEETVSATLYRAYEHLLAEVSP